MTPLLAVSTQMRVGLFLDCSVPLLSPSPGQFHAVAIGAADVPRVLSRRVRPPTWLFCFEVVGAAVGALFCVE